jgi:hypothetical protein
MFVQTIPIYQATRRHDPPDHKTDLYLCKNFKSHGPISRLSWSDYTNSAPCLLTHLKTLSTKQDRLGQKMHFLFRGYMMCNSVAVAKEKLNAAMAYPAKLDLSAYSRRNHQLEGNEGCLTCFQAMSPNVDYTALICTKTCLRPAVCYFYL